MQEAIYARLQRELMRGGLPPGQKLSSRKLAAQLGVSDMPVRAVLVRLLAEKALIQNPNGTFSVPPISLRVFREVMGMRSMLESEATRQACGRIDRAGFQELYACIDGMNQAGVEKNIENYLRLNQQLKFTIYRYATSQTLQSHIQLLWLRAGPFLRHLSKNFREMRGEDYHIQAVEFLTKNDGDSAATAISKDILHAMGFLTMHGEFSGE